MTNCDSSCGGRKESWWLTMVEDPSSWSYSLLPRQNLPLPQSPHQKSSASGRGIHCLAVRERETCQKAREFLSWTCYGLRVVHLSTSVKSGTGCQLQRMQVKAGGASTGSMSNFLKHMTSPALDSWFRLGRNCSQYWYPSRVKSERGPDWEYRTLTSVWRETSCQCACITVSVLYIRLSYCIYASSSAHSNNCSESCLHRSPQMLLYNATRLALFGKLYTELYAGGKVRGQRVVPWIQVSAPWCLNSTLKAYHTFSDKSYILVENVEQNCTLQ
jgi:hypothetical protein